MRIAVYGSGAVGGYFGGRLAQAGEDVTFIARGAQLEAIRRDGLHVSSIAGDFTVHPARATDDPAAVGAVDVVLVGVKAWQLVDVAKAMQPLIGSATVVLPLENGIEAPDELARVIGRQHVLGGLCRIFAWVESPGHITHAGIDPQVAFGELDGTRSARVERLRSAFDGAHGVRAEVPDDIGVAMWSKFLFITGWGGVGALTRVPVGVLRRVPESRALLQRALREICDVAGARGVALPHDSAERVLAYIDGLPADGTTSMQRDVGAGRPSELEAQVGAIVRLADAAKVDVPLHRVIHAALLPLELTARGTLPAGA